MDSATDSGPRQPFRGGPVALTLLVGLVGLLAALRPAHGENAVPRLVGKAFKVTDGDTIKVQLSSGAITVRFDSIDAPESNQPHGAAAKAALSRLVLNQTVELDVIEQDRYERLVAVVYVRDNLNVNRKLVDDGHAWAYRRYLEEGRRRGRGVVSRRR